MAWSSPPSPAPRGSCVSPEARSRRVGAAFRRASARSSHVFDLGADLPIRATLLRVSAEESVLVMLQH
ncbi:hypothetical protein ABZ260_46645, partial [Streptosporangium sp. NPDC006013]|uniref:hypothetical protein n=1 Tax=Streptosporangium sp. NPDC006013 TaxID=3155596 RepID=UPI0033BE18E3